MMMVMSDEQVEISTQADWRRRLGASAAVLGWLLLVALIGSFYIGHSPGPYGVCYAASGRSIPCELAHR